MDHCSAINDHTAERYLLGELDNAERDAYEEHFFSCPNCAEEINSASEFMESARQVVQKEIRADFYRHAARSSVWGSWLNWRSILQPLPAAACALLITLAGVVGYQNFSTIPGLTQMASLDISTEAPFMLRASRSEVQILTVARGESGTLPFEIIQAKGYTSYQVSVLAKANGKILLAKTVSPQDAKKFQLRVRAGMLQSGRYDVLIEGVNGNKKELLDRLPFELKFQD